jgi:hypothetical protein
MSRFRKLTHVIWHCQYHIVWVPKYRYRVLDGDLAEEVRACLLACLVCIVAQNQKPRSLTAGPVLVLQVCWQINETPGRSEISSI